MSNQGNDTAAAFKAEIAAWKDRAEAAEKERDEFRAALDRGPAASVEAQAEINHWREREAVLREALERIDKLPGNDITKAYRIASAALSDNTRYGPIVQP